MAFNEGDKVMAPKYAGPPLMSGEVVSTRVRTSPADGSQDQMVTIRFDDGSEIEVLAASVELQ